MILINLSICFHLQGFHSMGFPSRRFCMRIASSTSSYFFSQRNCGGGIALVLFFDASAFAHCELEEKRNRREIIIIFPFFFDNILVDLSTYASFTFSFAHELMQSREKKRRSLLLFFFLLFCVQTENIFDEER